MNLSATAALHLEAQNIQTFPCFCYIQYVCFVLLWSGASGVFSTNDLCCKWRNWCFLLVYCVLHVLRQGEERERHGEKMLRYWQPWAKCEKEKERKLRWEGNLELKNRWGKGKRQPSLYYLSECSSLLSFYTVWKPSKLEHFSSLSSVWLPSLWCFQSHFFLDVRLPKVDCGFPKRHFQHFLSSCIKHPLHI